VSSENPEFPGYAIKSDNEYIVLRGEWVVESRCKF